MVEANPVRVASAAQPKPSAGHDEAARDDRLFAQAREFEAVFIAEMLKYSGFSEALSSEAGYGGEAFSSLLVEQYAGEIVESGGFGLAEHIYAQLLEREAQHATDASA